MYTMRYEHVDVRDRQGGMVERERGEKAREQEKRGVRRKRG